MDPPAGLGGAMDPPAGVGGAMDPPAGVGGAMDPPAGLEGAMDPHAGVGGAMDPPAGLGGAMGPSRVGVAMGFLRDWVSPLGPLAICSWRIGIPRVRLVRRWVIWTNQIDNPYQNHPTQLTKAQAARLE